MKKVGRTKVGRVGYLIWGLLPFSDKIFETTLYTVNTVKDVNSVIDDVEGKGDRSFIYERCILRDTLYLC